MDPTEDSDAPDYIGPRENVLYLLAELERAFGRDGIAASTTQDIARVQGRLAQIMARLMKTRRDVEESFSSAHPTNLRADTSSATDGSSLKSDR